MSERFSRYSKTIIQNRALPDVRDGLKPVQRRILYAMYKGKNTFDKPYKKSAKTVGDVMGSYHPHGDSSIYEAMVRMSQEWKQNEILIDMHGNNGSIDGDSAAAMRYTESRLSKISFELLKDIEKNVVSFAPNYDDSLLEPTVLPSRFPNLLVNGSTGISAGYATNIPPHNLGEIIEATIKRLESPNCRLDTILNIVKGPDFPTGAIIEGTKGIKDAYKTGRGRIIIRSKVEILKKRGKEQIIIHEIPYDVNKLLLVKKIDNIRIDKKIDGIVEVRDESDRLGLRIAIDLKKEVDSELILNYLFKNTELQTSYNFNMVAIVNKRPVTNSLLQILDAYIEHQKQIVTKRTEFDLNHAQNRLHIVEGLIKMVSILDKVIKTIRSSKNKKDAENNLIKEYKFTEKQAEAIVLLQLYRLTNTDIKELIEESQNLKIIINGLEKILSSEEQLKKVIVRELKEIKLKYSTPRKSEIQNEITEIIIDPLQMVAKEDCIVVVTNEGYIKRVSQRSYKASSGNTDLKELDYIIGLYEVNTLDTILLFTNFGNYLYLPVSEIPDLKWGDLGRHVSNLVQLGIGEKIISSIPVANFEIDETITIFTKNGIIKRTKLKEFQAQRYSKPLICINLKKGDEVINVTKKRGKEVLIVTHLGYALRYNIDEVSITGIRTAGVKSIDLKKDHVINGMILDLENYLIIFTDKGTGKRIKLTEIKSISRARRGNLIIRAVKTNPYYVQNAFIGNSKSVVGLKLNKKIKKLKITELPIMDSYSTGSVITKAKVLEVFVKTNLEKIEEEKSIDLKKVDEEILIIDDFLTDFVEN